MNKLVIICLILNLVYNEYPKNIDRKKHYYEEDFEELGLEYTNEILIDDSLKDFI
jgi:hypothetical protein